MNADPRKYTQAQLDAQYKAPSLRIVNTIGGYYRIEISGPDALRSQEDRPRCFSTDIARAYSKDEALQMAREWFDRMRDETLASQQDPKQGEHP